jgi:hypothetical protein
MLHVRRREFITLLGGAAVAGPLSAGAQQRAIPVIGFLHSTSPDATPSSPLGFRRGLTEIGYVEGLNVAVAYRCGIVQGIGAVLFEECIYSDDGNLLNGTMADYLVPMAGEMPDIVLDHVETPEASTKLGAKGIGEGGLIGAMGAVWVAVNDALKPLGAKIRHQPFTPERVLDALARAELKSALL